MGVNGGYYMGKSLNEKCRLVTGHGAWHIGDIHVSDGPHGIRAQEDGAKNNDSYEATCFPTASSVAEILSIIRRILILLGSLLHLTLIQCRNVESEHP